MLGLIFGAMTLLIFAIFIFEFLQEGYYKLFKPNEKLPRVEAEKARRDQLRRDRERYQAEKRKHIS